MKRYTCNDYRQEMMLAGLRKQLANANLDESEKKQLEEQIRQLEAEMGLD
jgi:hypothetical protein